MYVLGIHVGHDSNVALVKDGIVVADIAEERLRGVKHFSETPSLGLEWCLREAGISMEDVDIIAVVSLDTLNSQPYFVKTLGLDKERLNPKHAYIEPPTYIKSYQISKGTELVHVDHHLAHAASAYFTSGYNDKCLIITADGIGDSVSLAVWRGEDGGIEPLMKVGAEGSLGWFYGAVTEALGWWVGDGEGKTMGLAPYGNTKGMEGIFDSIIPHYENGRLIKGHNFGDPCYWQSGGSFHWHLRDSEYVKGLVDKYGRENIAAEAQWALEEEMLKIILPWLEREGVNKFCCSGGVFLNIKLNQRVWESKRLDHQHIFPNAGDGGLGVGAALYAYYHTTSEEGIKPISHIYWGPAYLNHEIEEILKARNIPHRFCDDISLKCAQLLAAGKILGWFQGRMESGPRALGNRSILIDPRKAENKDIINKRVKFREPFRPFCPSLPLEAADKYLENWRMERYMITSFNGKEETRGEIPAVVHVDKTLRPQIVERSENEKFWSLLTEFGELTGTPVLLNTSFNIKGEPIVCSPRDAIRCFYDTGMDYLALGDFLISKDGRC